MANAKAVKEALQWRRHFYCSPTRSNTRENLASFLSLSTSLTKLKPEGPRFSKSPVSGGPRHPHPPRHHALPAALTWHPRNSYWFPPPAGRANLRGHVDVKKLASSRDHLRISFVGRNVRSTRAHVSRNACRDLISYLLFFIFLFRE